MVYPYTSQTRVNGLPLHLTNTRQWFTLTPHKHTSFMYPLTHAIRLPSHLKHTLIVYLHASRTSQPCTFTPHTQINSVPALPHANRLPPHLTHQSMDGSHHHHASHASQSPIVNLTTLTRVNRYNLAPHTHVHRVTMLPCLKYPRHNTHSL